MPSCVSMQTEGEKNKGGAPVVYILQVLTLIMLVLILAKAWMVIANHVGQHFKFGELLIEVFSKKGKHKDRS